MPNWFLVRDGSLDGPYSSSKLRAMAAAGHVAPGDLVQKEDGEPRPAASIKGLFSEPVEVAASTKSSQSAHRRDETGGLPPMPPMPDRKSGDAESFQSAALREGLGIAKSALRQGTSKLRTSFGSSFADTIRVAKMALGDILRNPIKLTFATTVLFIACLSALPGLLSIVLIPVFVLGYIRYTNSVLVGEQPTFGEFISFMRHGWDVLWHLLMLVAAFIVTFALMVAPVVLVLLFLQLTFGTLSAGVGQIYELTSDSAEPNPEEFLGSYDFAAESPPAQVKERTGLLSKLVGSIMDLGTLVFRLILFVVMLVVTTVVVTPIATAMILVFTLTLGLSSGAPSGDARFDLVYNSFARMLVVARTFWKRLLCGGLLLSTALTVLITVAFVLSAFLQELGLTVTAFWVLTVVLPIAAFAFVIYVSVFCLRTSQALESESIA